MLFETAGVPSDDEVRHAVQVLQRYREHLVAGEAHPPGNKPSGLDKRSEDPGVSLHPNRVRDTPLATSPLVSPQAPQLVTLPASFSLSLDADLSLGGFVFKDGSPFLHNDGGAGANNTALGLNALIASTPGIPSANSGTANSAFGQSALAANTTGYFNTASGAHALENNTSAFYNTASGAYALQDNTTGIRNTASGYSALRKNTTGFSNTASGTRALESNTTGSVNTASGTRALFSNTTGAQNTSSGVYSLEDNTSGERNTASGYRALRANTTGYSNTASGYSALRDNTEGNRNTAIGNNAGYNWTTGSNNIALGAEVLGVAGESSTTRIGNAQARTFIAGIVGVTTDLNDAIPVMIDSAGQLGTVSSSERVKEDIHELGTGAERLLDLRPVAFRYRKPFADGDKPIQFGLIAEQVAGAFPELVVYDAEGKPQTVKYHLLSTLLLSQIQKQQAELEQQERELGVLRRQMADRDRSMTALKRRLDRLAE